MSKELTKKELMNAINQPMCFGNRLVGKKMFAQIIKELCEYKTIEEEFGISLVIVITALMKGVEHIVDVPLDYEQHDSGFWEASKIKKSIVHSKVQLEKYKGEWTFKWGGWDKRLLLKDCGKTWALTKEELL